MTRDASFASAPASGANSLHRDTRGAALVEFIVAFMPLMTAFLCFCQLSTVAIAGLMVKHSAIIGARGAAVISSVHQNNPGAANKYGEGEIKDGVRAALGPWAKRMAKLDVSVDDQSSLQDPYGPVRVTVNASFNCFVPVANVFVCGGSTRKFTETVAFPHQGARYKLAGDDYGSVGGGGGGGGGGSF